MCICDVDSGWGDRGADGQNVLEQKAERAGVGWGMGGRAVRICNLPRSGWGGGLASTAKPGVPGAHRLPCLSVAGEHRGAPRGGEHPREEGGPDLRHDGQGEPGR